MPEFLALDWDSGQLCGLDAQVGKGKVRVRRCFALAWPEDPDPVEKPRQAARWLKDELNRLGVTSRELLVSLPREEVVVRKLELPDAPDEELPDLVRMQAATILSVSLEQLLIDFLPLPGPTESGGRAVLMATVSKAVVGRIEALVKEAGLELVSVGMNPAATAELVARAEQRKGDDPHASSLVIARHGRRVEISMIRGPRLLFTHSTELMGDDEQEDNQRILSEISRSFVALDQMLAGTQIARAWVLGADDANRSLCDALHGRLSCDVRTLDPLGNADVEMDVTHVPGERAHYAGPVGMLLSSAGGLVESIDLLNPRKPVIKSDRKKWKIGLAAAGLLLIATAGYGSLMFQQRELDASIDRLREQERNLDQTLEDGAPLLEAAGRVGDWVGESVHWLDQMQQLNDALSGTERLYLTDYRFSPSTGGEAVARIQATGYARERRDVEALYQRLVDREYRVRPHPISQSRRDADYPYQFELDVDLVSTPEAGGERG